MRPTCFALLVKNFFIRVVGGSNNAGLRIDLQLLFAIMPERQSCAVIHARQSSKIIRSTNSVDAGATRSNDLVPNFTEERVKRFARILESNESLIDDLRQLAV
jgi:hypothetical protein